MFYTNRLLTSIYARLIAMLMIAGAAHQTINAMDCDPDVIMTGAEGDFDPSPFDRGFVNAVIPTVKLEDVQKAHAKDIGEICDETLLSSTVNDALARLNQIAAKTQAGGAEARKKTKRRRPVINNPTAIPAPELVPHAQSNPQPETSTPTLSSLLAALSPAPTTPAAPTLTAPQSVINAARHALAIAAAARKQAEEEEEEEEEEQKEQKQKKTRNDSESEYEPNNSSNDDEDDDIDDADELYEENNDQDDEHRPAVKKRKRNAQQPQHTSANLLPCTVKGCTKMYTTKFNLARHMKRHTGEKPYACNACPKKFAEKQILQRHMRRHTGERPYPCKTCDQRFANKSDLDRHKKTHTGEKPYTCETCNRSFTRKTGLNEHKCTGPRDE